MIFFYVLMTPPPELLSGGDSAGVPGTAGPLTLPPLLDGEDVL